MLNVGRLSPGAADYYVGEVATSAEDYYAGRGESPGRWVGSLAGSIGLEGRVEPVHLRAVLDGRHPFTGEQLALPRARHDRSGADNPAQGALFADESIDVARAASRLRVTVGRVRQLLWAGDQPAGGRRGSYLHGRHVDRPDGRGEMWQIDKAEVERYEAAHRARKARPGYDLTLRPPKSVSLLWALAPDAVRTEIRRAHAESVDVVVAYVETHALYARRRNRQGGRWGRWGRRDERRAPLRRADHDADHRRRPADHRCGCPGQRPGSGWGRPAAWQSEPARGDDWTCRAAAGAVRGKATSRQRARGDLGSAVGDSLREGGQA